MTGEFNQMVGINSVYKVLYRVLVYIHELRVLRVLSVHNGMDLYSLELYCIYVLQTINILYLCLLV